MRSWPSTVQLQRRAYRHLQKKFAFVWHGPLAPPDDEDIHPLQEGVRGRITYPRRPDKR